MGSFWGQFVRYRKVHLALKGVYPGYKDSKSVAHRKTASRLAAYKLALGRVKDIKIIR